MTMVYKLGLADSLLSECSLEEKFTLIKRFTEICGRYALVEVLDENVWAFVRDMREPNSGRVESQLYEWAFDDEDSVPYILENYRNYWGSAPSALFPDTPAAIYVPSSRLGDIWRVEGYAPTIEMQGTVLDNLKYADLDSFWSGIQERLEQVGELPEVINDYYKRDDYIHFLEHLDKCCDKADKFQMCLVIN